MTTPKCFGNHALDCWRQTLSGATFRQLLLYRKAMQRKADHAKRLGDVKHEYFLPFVEAADDAINYRIKHKQPKKKVANGHH